MPDNPTVDYRAIARAMAQKYGVDPDIFERQIEAESNFDPEAESGAGAEGIAQIMPQYHPGVDTHDPIASLDYAAQLMAAHLDEYGGDYRKALAAYNAGPAAVADGSYTSFPETTAYIDQIMGPQIDAATSSDPNDPRNDPTNRDPRIGTNGAGGAGGPPVGMTAADLRAAQIREINSRSDLNDAQKQEAIARISQGDTTAASGKENADTGAGNLALAQAKQKWQEAIDARDFQAAEFWKARSAELGQNTLATDYQAKSGANTQAQNTTALDYTKLLASLKGPQDWPTYWKLAHGESPVPGQEGVSLANALPPWAQGKVNTAFTGQDVPPWAAGVVPGNYRSPGASNGAGVPNERDPGSAAQQGGAPVAAAAPAAAAAGPAASLPKWSLPSGYEQMPGSPEIRQVGATSAPAFDAKSGGMTVPQTSGQQPAVAIPTQGQDTAALTALAAKNNGQVTGPGGLPIWATGTGPR